MNKYELALETLKSEHKKFTNETATSLFGISIDTIIEACEKAEKYDNALLQYVNTKELAKQDIAKEIIEMLTIKGEYFFWKDGIYAYSKDIIQKIKERYGIKE